MNATVALLSSTRSTVRMATFEFTQCLELNNFLVLLCSQMLVAQGKFVVAPNARYDCFKRIVVDDVDLAFPSRGAEEERRTRSATNIG